jgi:hypothetical protein
MRYIAARYIIGPLVPPTTLEASMKDRLALTLLTIRLSFCSLSAYAQTDMRDEPTTIAESGYSLTNAPSGYKVLAALVLNNPYEDRFASNPKVRVTVRAADGSIITTHELRSAGIIPKGSIAIAEAISADEMPAKVEFRALSADYEPTEFRPGDFLPFTLSGLKSHPTNYGHVMVTGEVKNPYKISTRAWVALLFRDKQRRLPGGKMVWLSEIPAGDPLPFESTIMRYEAPDQFDSVETVVFDHNNYQSS